MADSPNFRGNTPEQRVCDLEPHKPAISREALHLASVLVSASIRHTLSSHLKLPDRFVVVCCENHVHQVVGRTVRPREVASNQAIHQSFSSEFPSRWWVECGVRTMFSESFTPAVMTVYDSAKEVSKCMFLDEVSPSQVYGAQSGFTSFFDGHS